MSKSSILFIFFYFTLMASSSMVQMDDNLGWSDLLQRLIDNFSRIAETGEAPTSTIDDFIPIFKSIANKLPQNVQSIIPKVVLQLYSNWSEEKTREALSSTVFQVTQYSVFSLNSIINFLVAHLLANVDLEPFLNLL
jgi:hypothetical protein